MPRYYDPEDRIGELLRQRGDIAAQRALGSGDVWGRAIGDIGGQLASGVGAVFQAREQRKQAEEMGKRDQAWTSFIESGEWQKDPSKTLGVARRIWGPEAGKQLAGLEAAQKLAVTEKANPEQDAKNLGALAQAYVAMGPAGRARLYPGVRGLVEKIAPGALPEQHSPEFDGEIANFAAQFGTKKESKRQTVTVPGPGGVPIEKSFTEEELAAGVPKYVAPKEASGPKYEKVTVPGPDGRPVTKMVTQEELRGGIAEYVKPERGVDPEKDKERAANIEGWIQSLETGQSLAQVPAEFKGAVNKAFLDKHGFRPYATAAESEKAAALDSLEMQIGKMEETAKEAIQKFGGAEGLGATSLGKQANKLAGAIVSGDIGIPLPFSNITGMKSLNLGGLSKAASTDPTFQKIASQSAELSGLARAQGEKGALSDGDVERVSANQIKLGDPPEVMTDKINKQLDIIRRGRASLGRPDKTRSVAVKDLTRQEKALTAKYGY